VCAFRRKSPNVGMIRARFCGARVTVGVMHRVGKLADRDEGFRPAGAPAFQSLIRFRSLSPRRFRLGPPAESERTYRRSTGAARQRIPHTHDARCVISRAQALRCSVEAVARMRAGRSASRPAMTASSDVRIFEESERTTRKWQMQLCETEKRDFSPRRPRRTSLGSVLQA